MTEGDLFKRFPNMKPISGPLVLASINGCGTGIHGSRDRDPETGSYVTTRCLTLVFVPVIPLCAFRIADAETGGWYFLGKEPLSTLCRTWNWLLLVLAPEGL